MDSVDVAVVGGGAAGLATAIFAARVRRAARIIVLDGAKSLGAKILVSGGGRCNVTNVRVTPEDFEGGSRNVVRRILREFDERRAVAFFAEIGVELYEDYAGKLFPKSDKARTVLDALLREAGRLGIEIRTRCRVQRVHWNGGAFQIEFQDTHRAGAVEADGAGLVDCLVAQRCVLATGGKSLPKTGSDGGGYEIARSLGHSIVPPTPALVPLLLEGDFHAALSGIALGVELTLRADGEKPVRRDGSMLFTHFGISGPVSLDISRFWERARLESRAARLTANLVPGARSDEVEQRLVRLAQGRPRAGIESAIGEWLPARVAIAILDELKIPRETPLAHFSRAQRQRLATALTEWPLPVRGTRGYNYAEVTAGGVPLTEIEPASLESRRCDGLFLVGEILDVDGPIGGFNFQWAWSSGFVAGRAAAAEISAP